MPCPHYRIMISTRSKSPPTTASAAYQSGERLYDERTHRSTLTAILSGTLSNGPRPAGTHRWPGSSTSKGDGIKKIAIFYCIKILQRYNPFTLEEVKNDVTLFGPVRKSQNWR